MWMAVLKAGKLVSRGSEELEVVVAICYMTAAGTVRMSKGVIREV